VNAAVIGALARPGVQGALCVAALLGAWEAAVALGWLRPFQFPPPSRIAAAAWELAVSGFPTGTRIGEHALVTIRRIFTGFAAATAAAIPLGLLIGRSAVLDQLTLPVVTFARSVATLSLLPLALLWFGLGETSKVMLIAYACFWVMLSNAIAAAKYVDPVLVRAARTMDVGGPALFFRVILPAATPRLLAGARVAIGVGFMVIVGAEMIATVAGLGALIMEARTFYRTDVSIVGMVALGALGFGFTAGLARLERSLLPWDRGLAEVRR
jgi:ABC-type nitrate/sulfonate/bicarbonate transport system permease component